MDLVPYIFHEQQEGNLCAQHCLNAVLQGPYFTAIDLAELARQLDQKEQEALGNSGPGSRSTTSQNMDDSGFFSVQVLSHALSIWNIQIIPWGSKEVSSAKAEPEREAAFICNLDQHWYTLRRFGPSTQRWYDLNSMLPRPQHMSATYVGMTLSQLEAEGYSIFVVRSLNAENSEAAATEGASVIQSPSTTKPEAITQVPPPATLAGAPEISGSTAAGPPSFLTERQEMEKIRRERIAERERAAQEKANPLLSTSSTVNDTSSNNAGGNKRTRVDRVEEEPGQNTKSSQSSKSVLVNTPSFLPRCEVDDMAATMPLTETAQGAGTRRPDEQTFGGTGYRLGGSPPRSNAVDSPSLPPGFSLADTDLEQMEGEADAEWEMMQQAIVMSLEKK
ncbi:Ataxin-3 [Dissophora globulifera]|uniref:Ataxin-3 homolog n=1 Tax=Dissophora globulifera TaxID=979702 RepID=A0A9P6UZ87_9FUNG|nr:Ataxin-3 [Dissophora globulifera]